MLYEAHDRRLSASSMIVAATALCFFYTVTLNRRARRAVVEHERVVSAIEDRDRDLAEIMMSRHIAAARTRRQAALVATLSR